MLYQTPMSLSLSRPCPCPGDDEEPGNLLLLVIFAPHRVVAGQIPLLTRE